MMDTSHNFRKNVQRAMRIRERGVVLMVALIALVALTLAGVALMRSVDTGNLIAGNMAFRQAALQASDIGVEAAFIALPNIVRDSKSVNIPNQYFALRQNTTPPLSDKYSIKGVPLTINWANVPCRDNSNAVLTCSSQDYKVKYVIDRLCTGGNPIVTNYQANCSVEIGSGASGSKGAFTPIFSSVDAVFYRVTVEVTGPRNTKTYTQAIFTSGNS